MKEKRLVILACAFLAFAFVLELQLTNIMCSDYYQKAEAQNVRSVEVSTGRADIVDCNLEKITGTEDQVKALITAQTDLQRIFENIRPQDREKFYQQVKNQSQVVVNLVNPVQSDTIYTTSKRYSSHNLAQNLIGYTDIDGNGIAGLEKVFDDKLKDKGEQITVYFNVNGNGDIYGDVYSQVSEGSRVLSLTIDNSLQKLCEDIAKENIVNGSIVIMETESGKIKAMASAPTYDANNIADYLERENSPLLNKALQCYEPGSVIKPLWAALALEEGYNKDRLYTCKGYTTVDGHTYHCANDTAHGTIDMEGALINSCNCYFIDMVLKDKDFVMKQMANQVSFGEKIQLCDGFSTNEGYFPRVRRLKNTGMQSSVSFGQGDFLVSPVHIAAYMNMIANDGVYVSPQIAMGIYDAQTGRVSENLYEYNRKRVISSESARQIKDMLVQVVRQGARGRRQPEHLSAAGKTGTAQTGKTADDGHEIFTAWFCGFYPVSRPKYTICVCMYDGGESSVSTTPIFKEICDEIYKMGMEEY